MHRFRWKSFIVAAGSLFTVALFLLAWAFPNFPGDERALLELQKLETGWLDSVALAMSSLGGLPLSVVPMLGVTAYLILLRRRADALIVLLSV
ncbi:MAG: hypothetical protein ACE5JL_10105, partial [Dehalococcoidia bacterium]